MDPDNIRPRSTKEVRDEVQRLLATDLSNTTLGDAFEDLSQAYAFPGLTHLWGPPRYCRNRAMFRPFILGHFGHIEQDSDSWNRVAWKGETGQKLDQWLNWRGNS